MTDQKQLLLSDQRFSLDVVTIILSDLHEVGEHYQIDIEISRLTVDRRLISIIFTP